MSEIKWIKLQTDIFDNRKIKQLERLPDGDTLIVIWLKILVLAGSVNDGGLVYFTQDIPYTDQLLATEFNRPLPTVQLALRTFQQFGMIEIVNDLIHVSNWERYQNIEGLEKVREQTRKRVAAYREKQKQKLIGDDRVCVYCGEYGDTIDHVIPRSKGGLDEPSNVVPCCLACNMEKTNDDLASFLNRKILLNEKVDFDGIESNPILRKYVKFDHRANRYVTLPVTQRNATDKEEDKEKEKESDKKKRFTAPTVEEVQTYCQERGNTVDAQRFVDYYGANGWKVGKNPMKDWKAAVRTWENNGYDTPKKSPKYMTTGKQQPLSSDDWDKILDAI